jgi:ribosomal protein S18 acetylase RimI-like enzyme
MGDATFRTATRDDIDMLVDLVDAAYRGERSRAGWTHEADLLGGQRVDVDMVAASLADPAVVVLLLTDEDRLLACCELRRDADAAALGMFAVDPSRQAGGLGRRVLAEAERVVTDRWGATRIRLSVIDTRTELIGWYERRGYRRTGATAPFPYGDERFGVPLRDDLRFAVLDKRL